MLAHDCAGGGGLQDTVMIRSCVNAVTYVCSIGEHRIDEFATPGLRGPCVCRSLHYEEISWYGHAADFIFFHRISKRRCVNDVDPNAGIALWDVEDSLIHDVEIDVSKDV